MGGNPFQSGYGEAIGGVIVSLIINAVIPGFISSGLSQVVIYLIAFNAIVSVITILAFPRASLGYLLGWAFGMWIMFQASLLDPLGILTFVAAVALYVYVNYVKK